MEELLEENGYDIDDFENLLEDDDDYEWQDMLDQENPIKFQ